MDSWLDTDADLRELGEHRSQTRLESDSLGKLPVPGWALYGIQTERARQNFPISGLKPIPAFLDATLWVKRAAALTHKEIGRLDANLADAIVQAADEILGGQHRDQFVVDPYQAGAGTSHNMNCNEVLANRANEILGGKRGTYNPVHPNNHVNMAQSANDLLPTAIRLATLTTLPKLTDAMRQLAKALFQQDAAPVRMGQEFTAFARTIERNQVRLESAADVLRELGIGGSAVGAGLNVEAEFPRLMVRYIAEVSGLELREREDRVQLMQSMGDLAGFSATLGSYAIDLGKIASDIQLLASGKANSVTAGMVNMVCYQAIGNDLTVTTASQAGQLELAVMMPVVAHNILFTIEILANATRTFAEWCIAGIEADEAGDG